MSTPEEQIEQPVEHQVTKRRVGRPTINGPRRNLTMNWPWETIDAVDKAAAKEGITRTEFTLRSIDERMERMKRQKQS